MSRQYATEQIVEIDNKIRDIKSRSVITLADISSLRVLKLERANMLSAIHSEDKRTGRW